MSNLSKLEFVALDISEKNCLSWVLDVEIHLDAKGLHATIIQGNEPSRQDKAKAMIFLCYHLDEGMNIEHLTEKDPLELWNDLKGRYDHLKATVLPRARYEWMHLRFQDFKTNHEARPTGTAPLPKANMVEARDQSEVKRDDHRGYNNTWGVTKKTDDDKPGTSQKYDKNIEANLALKDDVFDGLGDITHMEVDDFFGDRN
ncbi:uncharacterized protein [Solanum lycopersicum]|uniref:uncharacterized protein n=1 Tax=Solanum lycopersicum TaxID=4081 RepID=UPI0008FED15D|nr:uncharacterized protein LOC109121234 [Solanum lycopersicum]